MVGLSPKLISNNESIRYDDMNQLDLCKNDWIIS